MRKAIVAILWTLLLAVPATVLSIVLAAYVTENLESIWLAIWSFDRATSVFGRGWAVELAARWPEIAGMIVGQVVILIILLLVRTTNKMNGDQKKV